MSFSVAINLLPPPPPPPPTHTLRKKDAFPNFQYIILSVCQFEISARIRLNWALVVGYLIDFLVALSKVFCKACKPSMRNKSHDWQSLLDPVGDPTSSGISSHLATRVEDWSRG